MGKKGDRGKNRASSSSLSAVQLPTGAPAFGFGGFLGSSRIEPPTSSSSEESTAFSDVDSEVSQHLKRLGRKDPTTKIKALTTLCLLFKQKFGEEIAQFVPQWAFEYKRLLLDYNREVRRATHDAMTSLVVTVRKGLVPHLKSLMGPWWFSQFDPIPEVSQAAKRSLEAAFPAPERRLDALILCVNEIFLYLDENLKLTPQGMSDKATPMDELEDMHRRVISSSLLAVATIVDILLGLKIQINDSESATSEHKLASKGKMATISSAEKMFTMHNFFLEFFKSKSPDVRSAAYSVLTCFIKHIPHAFNEGNMKTVSGSILGVFIEKDASCHSSMWDMVLLFSRKFPDCWSYNNIQKVVLPRFWNFLRHGCYGSQQLSYPALVLFLESVPPKAVAGEQFIFIFLQNLWAGRNPLHSSPADMLAFFKAFKECFLWGFYNALRCSIGEDVRNPVLVDLVSNILVSLLWPDYLLLVNSKSKDEKLFQRSDCSAQEGIKLSDESPLQNENLSIRYSTNYVQELGKCIVGILADIYCKDSSFLTIFSTSFHKDALEMFKQGERLPKFPELVQRLSNFFQLTDQHVLQKGQAWPLDCMAGPLLANSYTVIKSLDSPDAVTFLFNLVEIFGPVKLFSYLRLCNKEQCSNSMDDNDSETEAGFFLQIFKDDIVPWCLQGYSRSSNAKLDLLIALLQDDYFSEQWHSIISFATNLNNCSETDIRATNFIGLVEVLGILFEKVREKLSRMKMESVHKIGSLPEHWQHKCLDSAAISVVLHSPSTISCAKFLCSVLGGSREGDEICFLSREAVISIFEEILKFLVSLIPIYSFQWARLSCSSLLSCGLDFPQIQKSTFGDILEMTQFSFEVLEGSIFCLKMLGEECILLPYILAAIFIIDWECSMSLLCNDPDGSLATSRIVADDNSQEQVDAKLHFPRMLHTFRSKISISFWRSLSSSNLSMLKSILVQTVRSAVFEISNLSPGQISSLCCDWVLEMRELLCHDQGELQHMLDQLLLDDGSWTLWVTPLSHDESRSAAVQIKREHTDAMETRHDQFIAFVEKLNVKMGFSKVIAGLVPQTLPLASSEDVQSFSYSRAWLAAELLCTWRWRGGSAADSFLYSFSTFAKVGSSCTEFNIVFSIVNILFDGALIEGANSLWISFDRWIPSDDEVEQIQDSYLRALTSVLLTLFIKDKVWWKHESLKVFELVVDKLFTDSTVNRTCLRILPFILSVTVEPLLLRSSEFDGASKDVLLTPWKNDLVLENILSWLQKALSFSPLGTKRAEEPDLEEWLQLIISCYPLRDSGKPDKFTVEIVRDICHIEKNLLLSLFRKHSTNVTSLTAYEMSSASSSNASLVSPLPTQLILAKLTSVLVGYCWLEISENVWHFVLETMQRWVESSVLLVEEMAEKIDEIVMNSVSENDSELVVEKIETTVHCLDPIALDISSNALLVLSIFSQVVDLQEADGVEVLQSLKFGKWAEIKDRLMENILRLFFATGVAEAIASSFSYEAAFVVASSRLTYSQFWERIASFVVNSPNHVRNAAVKSMKLWGLSKGPINSLYAIIFSANPIPSLQYAAYILTSTEPLCHLSILKENYLVGSATAGQDSDLKKFESFSGESFCLADEITCIIQKPSAELLKMDLVSQDRVNYFLAWAILLSYLHSLSPSSSTREMLIQHVQESVSSAVLDCVFQNIPLNQAAGALKKKKAELADEASIAANAAKHVIDAGSVVLRLERVWPVGTEQMASLAGSIFGMMIWLLPSFVSNWFTSLRDRPLSSAIEAFTRVWCSPNLLSNELSQVKETVIADENFSVTVNKSAYEIIATYKKEETGMDLVIHLPSCYPLRPVDVDCTRSLGISEVKKRKWLLSLTAFIRNQNGAVGEAIRIWKTNIDKEFHGIDECPICYSIIHTTNHSLPRLACKTCKYKFHSACLYKWFSTSHKSTCPLCQTPF